ELEAKHAESLEPVQGEDVEEGDDGSSVTSCLTSVSRQGADTVVGSVSAPGHTGRLESLERKTEQLEERVAALPNEIMSAVRESFQDMFMAALTQALPEIVAQVSDSVLKAVQPWITTQIKNTTQCDPPQLKRKTASRQAVEESCSGTATGGPARLLPGAAPAPGYQSTQEDTGNTVIPPLRYLVTLAGHSDPESPEPRGSVADPNASSARQPLRLGMATGMLGAYEATTTSRHGETAPAECMALTGPGSSTLDGRHDEITGPSRQNNEERPRTDDDWQTVLTLRQKNQQARERKRGTDSTGSTSPTKPHQRRRRTPKLPPLPKEDFEIVLRPHQGLPLKTISTPALGEAIVRACSNEIRAWSTGKGKTAIPSTSKCLVQVSGNPPKQIPLSPTRGHPPSTDIATSSWGTTEGEGRHSCNASTQETANVMRRIIGEYQGSEEDLIEHIKNICTGEQQATPPVAREYQG
ncbi:hypothetical protein MTO96_031310, partial [Rhipicephalus appendiculatus]